MATLHEISAVGQCGLSPNQDSEWPLAPGMETVVVGILLPTELVQPRSGGMQVTLGTGISSGILKDPPHVSELMV